MLFTGLLGEPGFLGGIGGGGGLAKHAIGPLGICQQIVPVEPERTFRGQLRIAPLAGGVGLLQVNGTDRSR